MKILQVNKFLYYRGGAETYMFQLSKVLQDLGHEVKFWGMYDKTNIVCDFPALEVSNIDYAQENSIGSVTKAFKTVYSVHNRRKIAKVLDLYKPDVVHIHNYNFQITPSILPEIKKRGIKIVQTVHDSKMVCPNYRMYNLKNESNCTKCITGSFVNCTKDRCFDDSLLRSLLATIESSFYSKLNYYNKYIDSFIIPSKFLANLIKNRINQDKIIVIPNFVDIAIPNKNIEETNEFLYYGRILKEKGIFELIDIFRNSKLKLTLIGTGPEVDLLEEKIKNLDNINFLGPKYGNDLFSYVQKVKYVIQPAKGYENCPMTVLESFALGTPVIGANHSGFIELINNGKTGFLLDFSDIKNTKIQLSNIAIRSTEPLKEHIKKVYSEKYVKEAHISRVLEVYENILNIK